ncbi:NTP transferase domain-containing protein [Natronomonas gomsonensis]|uniref:bifunctional sugar-1-phosphate nucleotidylyltransferase/acetyltransferase n=1 Tax=Natronomonas gomsonensis TaxID=1046043 RepID=UPI00227A0662|nr:bifunctional sugar-1-phosphate nucleotidylyltransferase/acetyltransferase [Natronomonas gomsonensis]MCY4732542.1 NTP transferase domain-containing protein [Natronomonas gomsonensis]
MKVAILAAGEGNRLRPLTNRRPKPMLPVANRPILEYVIEAVAEAGIEEIVLIVGYEHDRIQTHFGDGDAWGVDIEYVRQTPQLGTGHAVQQVKAAMDGEFLVCNGDRIIDSKLIERAVADSTAAPAVAVTRVSTPGRYGVVDIDGDHIVGIDEKPEAEPTSEIINAGVYRFSPDVFDAIERTDPAPSGELTLPGTIETLAGETAVTPIRYRGLWMDVSQLWDLLSANDVVLDRHDCPSGGDVDPTAAVAERVCTNRDSAVGPNATLRGGTTLGANVTVEANAVVANSVVMQDATIGAGAVLTDCIVGENATIGANTTVAGGHARVIVEGTVYDDVRLGGVVGDNAEVGGNVTIEAGSVVGDNVEVADSAVIDGRIDPNTVIERG